jgi:hypothetical protein
MRNLPKSLRPSCLTPTAARPRRARGRTGLRPDAAGRSSRCRTALDLAGDGGDHRHLQQFGRRQWRQDRGQLRRQHRFARARRADHQEMMAAGGGELERPLGTFLALDVAQVELCRLRLMDLRLRPRQHLRALEVIGDLDQRVRCDDLDVRARPGGLGAADGWADQALLACIGPDRRRQHARNGRDRAVEAEFAEHGEAR